MVEEQLVGNGGILTSDWQLTDARVYPDPPEYLFNADQWPQCSGKAGAGRGSAFFVGDDNGEFVLRNYRRGGMIAAFSSAHYVAVGRSASRAFREWRLLATLFNDGLPVPAPVAAGYTRVGLFYTASLLTRRIPASQTLTECLRAAPLGAQDWHALGSLLRRFHDRGACHADLNAHNILRTDGGAFFLIDFDRGSLRSAGDWQAANLARLRRSLDKLAAEPAGLHITDEGWRALESAYASSSSASDA